MAVEYAEPSFPWYHAPMAMKQSGLHFQRVTSVDKVPQIIAALQSFVADGSLKEGMELPPERELAAKLGVSRFSLREALRSAETQGLLELRRGRRPRVAAPTSRAAAEVISLSLRRSKRRLFDLAAARQGLETQIAWIAARTASRTDMKSLAQTIAGIEKHRDDPTACVEQDIKFHELLVRSTGNLVFEIMLTPLSELLREFRMQTYYGRVDRVISDHREILEAVRRRDPEAASSAMRRHLELAEKDLRRHLKGTPPRARKAR
jgi:GntR family transcriptional repressor for pyruvate dehydrogenase complex